MQLGNVNTCTIPRERWVIHINAKHYVRIHHEGGATWNHPSLSHGGSPATNSLWSCEVWGVITSSAITAQAWSSFKKGCLTGDLSLNITLALCSSSASFLVSSISMEYQQYREILCALNATEKWPSLLLFGCFHPVVCPSFLPPLSSCILTLAFMPTRRSKTLVSFLYL